MTKNVAPGRDCRLKEREGLRSIRRKFYGGVRTPRRFKPGFVAIRETRRVGASETLAEVRDEDFRLPRSSELAILGSLPPPMVTRNAVRVFHRVADKLDVLDRLHELEAEAKQYRAFLAGLQTLLEPTELQGPLSHYYESDDGIW